ncbi:hypothetical protein Fmac_026869 [Flemingia macrophylla]|uniref:PORR domain-containing protein n=1 Tax=Flemingia macrophylla TaxID=520843 RepID=A0ABD1LHS5_9FABA
MHHVEAQWLVMRRLCVWSIKKEAELVSTLSRNRRWVVNNQIKNIVLRYPNNEIPIATLQKKFKTIDLQGKARNWLSKYPFCFEIHGDCCRLTKRIMGLIVEEHSLLEAQEPFLARHLARDSPFSKSTNSKHAFVREAPLPSSCSAGTLILLCGLSCCLPSSWVKSWERFCEFDEVLYFSPYSDPRGLVERSREMEKRNVGLVHELLTLTLWKKFSIVKLGHFRREFLLPD